MRFLRPTLLALFCLAIGLGMGTLPINGTTLWQKLRMAINKTSTQNAFPVENYTASERANIDKLIREKATPYPTPSAPNPTQKAPH
ncbi:MAG: hypothetical protein FWG75_03925 [Cystobacterineae bacterium]|nr:hypothetical protein [Cystobacterineae bacterium]